MNFVVSNLSTVFISIPNEDVIELLGKKINHLVVCTIEVRHDCSHQR